ncbi:MAG: hypothetical protein DLM60_07860 [Pseudonocardiales bacterium]|nr:MAG: hypothetical protein DLM60_07860 [Pseudonocardiales bacterium]
MQRRQIMMRVVRAADRRTWMVRSRISWTRRAMADEFEHDMTDYGHGIVMLGIVVALTLFVVFWTPADVVRPAWFLLLILLFLLVLLVSWAWQRPWVITAHTDEPMGTEGERWEGVVRGMIPAREETYQVVDDLRRTGSPDDGTSALSRVSSSTPGHDS